jgi:Zn-dependent peptidase ImmA (M78 family)
MSMSLSIKDGEGSVIGDRLKAARTAAGLSTRALASRLSPRLQVSHATIANYERGLSVPSLPLISGIAAELGRPVEWFLRSGKSMTNVRYRQRKSQVTKAACVQFEFKSQAWLDAYLFTEERLNEPLGRQRKLKLDEVKGKQPDRTAKLVREAIGLRAEDPIPSVPGLMESFGIRVIEVDTDEAIDGLAARYGEENVAVLARGLEGDRARMNAAHEFGHFVAGDVDAETADADADNRAFEFGSHLLMPNAVLKKAIERESIVYLIEMKRLYGISLAAMIYRAEKSLLISPGRAKSIWIEFARRGWRQREPGRIAPDRALRFEVLLERAIAIGKASIDEVARSSGVAVSDLKRRLSEPIGYVDEDPPEAHSDHGLRLVKEG